VALAPQCDSLDREIIEAPLPQAPPILVCAPLITTPARETLMFSIMRNATVPVGCVSGPRALRALGPAAAAIERPASFRLTDHSRRRTFAALHPGMRSNDLLRAYRSFVGKASNNDFSQDCARKRSVLSDDSVRRQPVAPAMAPGASHGGWPGADRRGRARLAAVCRADDRCSGRIPRGCAMPPRWNALKAFAAIVGLGLALVVLRWGLFRASSASPCA